MVEPNFDLSDENMDFMDEIMCRVANKVDYEEIGCDEIDFRMSLAACHNHACKIDFKKLANVDIGSVLHDVFGINRHLNQETLELENFFWPRCALKETDNG